MTPVLVFQVLSVAILAVSYVADFSKGQSKGGLEETLSYWETFTVSNINRRTVKRDTRSQHPVEQLITFDSYGRKFSLLLRKDFSVLGSGFKIFVFEEDGTSHEVHLDLNLYRGTVEGEVKSIVSAYWNDNQVLSASIQTASELFVVEPAVNLIPNATNDTMIIYRQSDLRWDNNSRCGYVNDDGEEVEPVTDQFHANVTQSSRPRRALCSNTDKNTCHVYLVADPKFFKNVGKDDVKETVSHMLATIDRIDQIYRGHQFDDCDSGFGFEVKRVNVFSKTTAGFDYTDDRNFLFSEFLEAFSKDATLGEFCLGHIFTYQSFNDDGYVLGLAYTGNPESNKRGGICSTQSALRNVGWTSYLGKSPVPTLQAQLVTGHELGHNWGSSHDSDSSDNCNPSADAGGKYIMYPVSVSGEDKNNFLFSPCSRTSIGRVLQAKASCFIAQKSSFCGNYRIDKEEQCDPGFNVATDSDKCCDSNCKLRPNARCSDQNTLCCKDCQMVTAAADVTCFKTSDDICAASSKCSGQSPDCPASTPKPDGASCFNKGTCKGGVCQSVCAKHGYQTCSCDTEENACKRCCIDAKGACLPLFKEGLDEFLPDGTACMYGTCNSNVCIRSSRNPVARLWEILDLSSPSSFVRFMQNNIVWTIIITSLIIWIPCSCFVCYMDRRAKRQREELINEVVDEYVDGPQPVSHGPLAKRAFRRAVQKDKIRNAAARMFKRNDAEHSKRRL